MHFEVAEIQQTNCKTMLKDDAQTQSYLGDSCKSMLPALEVCRICLATDIKLYSIQHPALHAACTSILTDIDTDILPQYICYLCAAQVIKCHKLIQRSLAAKQTLMGLWSKYGEITRSLIKTTDHVQSRLTHNYIVPKTIYHLIYNDETKTYTHTSKIEENIKKEITENSLHIYNKIIQDDDRNSGFEESYLNINDMKNDISCDKLMDEDVPLAVTVKSQHSTRKPGKKKRNPRKQSSKNTNAFTSEEIDMQKYFIINILTLEEQISERESMKHSAAYRDALYKCEVCYKTYLQPDAYRTHMRAHDPSSGAAACAVCHIRFGSRARAAAHARSTHERRYRCRTCDKTFYNVQIAKKHQKRHEKVELKCDNCDFSTTKEAELSSHLQSCLSLNIICQFCELSFTRTEDLKHHVAQVHPNEKIDPEYIRSNYRCVECNLCFSNEVEWKDHRKQTPHNEANSTTKVGNKSVWRMPGDSYPTHCEHCSVVINNRKEHYVHVRRAHPKQRDSYQPVVTAVCDICGKGFQNSTKLHLHELRHSGVGSVQCAFCPRRFYDKYQLARHVTVHSDDRPYTCPLCNKGFKLRSNRDRHAKVHSGVTSYECTLCGKRFRYSSSRNLHVRTVHHRLPPPPRRKKGNTGDQGGNTTSVP